MGFTFYIHRDNPILHVFVCNAYKHDELSNSKYYSSTVEPLISDPHKPGPWPEHKKNLIIRDRKSSLTGSTKSIIVEKHMYKTSMLIKYVQRKREIVIVLSVLYYNPNPNPPAAACTKSCVTH